MSRWLSQVNNLLEKLDGTVEDAIEEQAVQREESRHGEGKDAIQSILARRGLSAMLEEEAKEAYQPKVQDKEHVFTVEGTMKPLEFPALNGTVEPSQLPESAPKEELQLNGTDQPKIEDPVPIDDDSSPEPETEPKGRTQDEQPNQVDEDVDSEIPLSPGARRITKRNPPPSPTRPLGHTYEQEYKAALADAREAQKEARTLRRHVVALNGELETVEAETKAQRSELERAGERMEKDRARAKEEKDRLIARHTEEMKALKKQNELVMEELSVRNEKLVEEARNQLRDVEQRRKEEGGDWTKELVGAIEREQEAQRKLLLFEDEKSILLAQISMLQSNSEGLGSRLEAISQAADSAMLREREAEEKLDAALSVHARQLSQRQSREGELERTIADLGAALVAARSKAGGTSNTSGDGAEGPHKLKAQFDQYEDDLDTIRNQLEHERQRAKTLHEELKDLTKERADEAASFRMKQSQYDRQLADMSVAISRLQSNVRDAKRDSLHEMLDSDLADDEKSAQIKSLSEQVLRQQEKLGQYGSELSALKNRLKVAVNRADQAEDALAEASASHHDVEIGPSGGGMRRRGGKRSNNGGSIRAAFRLNNPQNPQVETVGIAIDALDSFAVQTGKFLKSNPFARGGFLLYLIILHLWTFIVLFFHAHNYEPVHGDFGAGQQLAHGPHALMQQNALIHQQHFAQPITPIVPMKAVDVALHTEVKNSQASMAHAGMQRKVVTPQEPVDIHPNELEEADGREVAKDNDPEEEEVYNTGEEGDKEGGIGNDNELDKEKEHHARGGEVEKEGADEE